MSEKTRTLHIHAASYAAAVLIVTLFIDHRLAFLFLGLPLVVWARIKRKRHNVPQSLAAAAVIMLVTWGTCLVMGVK